LTANRLASEEATLPQTPAISTRKVASLVKRIRYLRTLLLHLARVEPSFAHRLVPELRTLRRLLSELSASQSQHLAPNYRPASVMAAEGGVDPTPLTVLLGLRVAAPAPIPNEYVPEAGGPQGGGGSPASGVAVPVPSASAPQAAEGALAPSAAPQPPMLLPNLSISSGPSRSAGAAGPSSGSAAGTLAAICGFCLLLGLLPDRLTLIVLPWRLTVPRHRLERPG
jgi:hypothetical protein